MGSEKREASSEKDPFEGYEPFGDQWKKELMRMNKKDIVELFANAMNPKGDSFFIVREDMTQAIGKVTFVDNWQEYMKPRLPLFPMFMKRADESMKLMCYLPGNPFSQKHEEISISTKTNQ